VKLKDRGHLGPWEEERNLALPEPIKLVDKSSEELHSRHVGVYQYYRLFLNMTPC